MADTWRGIGDEVNVMHCNFTRREMVLLDMLVSVGLCFVTLDTRLYDDGIKVVFFKCFEFELINNKLKINLILKLIIHLNVLVEIELKSMDSVTLLIKDSLDPPRQKSYLCNSVINWEDLPRRSLLSVFCEGKTTCLAMQLWKM